MRTRQRAHLLSLSLALALACPCNICASCLKQPVRLLRVLVPAGRLRVVCVDVLALVAISKMRCFQCVVRDMFVLHCLACQCLWWQFICDVCPRAFFISNCFLRICMHLLIVYFFCCVQSCATMACGSHTFAKRFPPGTY